MSKRVHAVHAHLARLRPFYFRTHPDFFGQWPNARRTNETALKAVAAHLQTLQATQPDGRVSTTSQFVPGHRLPVFLRNDDAAPMPSMLALPSAPCWQFSIQSVLAAAELAVPPVPQSGTTASTDTSTADAGPAAISLEAWLADTVVAGKDALIAADAAHATLVHRNQTLAATIRARFAMQRIDSPPANWSVSSSLKMLESLATELGGRFTRFPYSVRFTSMPSRLGADGVVELGVGDVPQVWGRMLQHRHDHDPVFALLRQRHAALGDRLHGASITSTALGPVALASFLKWLLPRSSAELAAEAEYRRHPLLRHVTLHPSSAGTAGVAPHTATIATTAVTPLRNIRVFADPTALAPVLIQNGDVLCPTHASMQQLSLFLAVNGPAALAKRATADAADQARDQALLDAGQRLGIRITHARGLTEQQCAQFVHGLLQSSHAVHTALCGLHVHASALPAGVYLQHPTRGRLEIPWQGPF
eukprot:m.419021 g.419021  ORF g.419021 m.419021 type:complete len:477 (-) comp31265_c0_seq1:2091-3521(-)